MSEHRRLEVYVDAFFEDFAHSNGLETPRGESFLYERCLWKSLNRCLASGRKEDAYDVYVSYLAYLENVLQFGAEACHKLTRTMMEFESNAGSLLNKHREHYVHSVYVLGLGIAYFQNNNGFRDAFHASGNSGNPLTRKDFLFQWAMVALFHDIGYPFEIATHLLVEYLGLLQEQKVYDSGATQSVFSFESSSLLLLNDGDVCTQCIDDFGVDHRSIHAILADKFHKDFGMAYEDAVNLLERYMDDMEYGDGSRSYVDHSYFSAITIFKIFAELREDADQYHWFSDIVNVAFCILLHNAYNRKLLKQYRDGRPLEVAINPLGFLIILCDEAQEWNRTAYGKKSFMEDFPFDCLFDFDEGHLKMEYQYLDISSDKTPKIEGSLRKLLDLDSLGGLSVTAAESKKPGQFHMPIDSKLFMELDGLAERIHNAYLETLEKRDPRTPSHADWSDLRIDLKLDNLNQAKGYAKHLDDIGCFYFRETLPLPAVREADIDDDTFESMAEAEHERWWRYRESMGWTYGEQNDRSKLISSYLVPYAELSEDIKDYDRRPVQQMIPMLYSYGLTIYRKG